MFDASTHNANESSISIKKMLCAHFSLQKEIIYITKEVGNKSDPFKFQPDASTSQLDKAYCIR